MASFFAPKAKKPKPNGAAAHASTTTTTTTTRTYRGAAVPEGWTLVHGALLVARVNGAEATPASRLTAFDFDDTLCPCDWGRMDPSNWSHLYSHAPKVLRKLRDGGDALAVLSNECLDRYKKPDVIEKRLFQKCGKIMNWAIDIGTPVLCCVALTKLEGDERRFHKSRGDGMWTYAVDALDVQDLAASCFVGDSKDDLNMATIAKVKYFHVQKFFTQVHPA